MSFKEYITEKGAGVLGTGDIKPHKDYLKKLDMFLKKVNKLQTDWKKINIPDLEEVDMSKWDEEDIQSYHSLISHHVFKMVKNEIDKIKKTYKQAGIK